MSNPAHTERVPADALRDFCVRVFCRVGTTEEDARIIADVLLAADLRGIDSHGVARLPFYMDFIHRGQVTPCPTVRTIAETPATALIDAGAGFGHPVARRAMQSAIDKARTVGAGFVAVRNSSHYGIAGYYAMMALEHDCIGFSVTNASPLAVPTFGRNAMLGTNPIALAAPAGRQRPFVLDMATSTVPLGKIEVYDRKETPIPLGWATDETGASTTDAARVVGNWRERRGGGLLPLGGAGELLSGHKGYGLALFVEIFSAVLSGAAYADLAFRVEKENPATPADIGHFFGAWRVDAFRPVEEFKAAMDDLQERLKTSPRAEGAERIYIPGEKEYEESERRARLGIPLNPKVAEGLRNVGAELGISSPC